MAGVMHTPAIDRLKDVIRAGRRMYFPIQDWAIRIFAKWTRRGHFIRGEFNGDDPLRDSARVAVYVHFDKDGIVHDYVLHQLCELVSAGYRITFVSNAPDFSEHSRARVLPLCRKVIWRFNAGYDFGAYKDGIASIADIDAADSLILMNDSVYGPFWSLGDMLARVDRTATDFWGIADSFEYHHHIQTFFMLFFPAAINSRAFRDFWQDLPYIDHKRWVIRNAEVHLTRVLERAGLRCGTLAPYRLVAEGMKRRLPDMDRAALAPGEQAGYLRFRHRVGTDRHVNPMQYFWSILIEEFRCPFIKRELIQSNPAQIPFTSRWPEVIGTHSDYNIDFITRHLNRDPVDRPAA